MYNKIQVSHLFKYPGYKSNLYKTIIGLNDYCYQRLGIIKEYNQGYNNSTDEQGKLYLIMLEKNQSVNI